MQAISVVFFVLMVAIGMSAQSVTFSGTIFDASGAVVPAANVAVLSGNSRSPKTVASDVDGIYKLELEPGLYSIQIMRDGFLTIKIPEYLIVNSSNGMKMDVVMFGSRFHEPCGVSGGDCLPSRMLIKDFSIKYAPGLEQITKDFSNETRKKN